LELLEIRFLSDRIQIHLYVVIFNSTGIGRPRFLESTSESTRSPSLGSLLLKNLFYRRSSFHLNHPGSTMEQILFQNSVR